MTNQECPFCPDQNHFKSALSESPGSQGFIFYEVIKKNMYRHPEETKQSPLWKHWGHPGHDVLVTAVARGGYWLATIDDRYFEDRLKGFKLQCLAFDIMPNASEPAWPLFHLDRLTESNRSSALKTCTWRWFNMYRLTHDESSIEVYSHEWFTHGAIITTYGFPFRAASKTDKRVWKDMHTYFYCLGTPGPPEEITKERLTDAWTKLFRRGRAFTIRQLADELGCKYDAVRLAVKRHNLPMDFKDVDFDEVNAFDEPK